MGEASERAATRLPVPSVGRQAAERFVGEHLGHLVADAVVGSPTFSGGQAAADAALAGFDVTGYASRRNEVWPPASRGASRLSPYIRHGLLTLPVVWAHVGGGLRRDVDKFRDELLWQEYARHWYARLGPSTRTDLRHRFPASVAADPASPDEGWPRDLACLDLVLTELERDGWLVNQTRMWLAAHWSAREGLRWQHGEQQFFRHLLDGSRAANRLGWQWTTGAGSAEPYLFSRWQVEKRAPGVCASCELRSRCPIQQRPPAPGLVRVDPVDLLRSDPALDATAGPRGVVGAREPIAVWLTAESLGDADPALAAHPGLPVVFVFDEPLLGGLRLSSKRLVFLVETLSELGSTRELELWRGDPVAVLAGRDVAVTFAPVPGFRTRAAAIGPAELHPWPWLRWPIAGSIASFSAWRRAADRSSPTADAAHDGAAPG